MGIFYINHTFTNSLTFATIIIPLRLTTTLLWDNSTSKRNFLISFFIDNREMFIHNYRNIQQNLWSSVVSGTIHKVDITNENNSIKNIKVVGKNIKNKQKQKNMTNKPNNIQQKK